MQSKASSWGREAERSRVEPREEEVGEEGEGKGREGESLICSLNLCFCRVP